MRHSGFTDASDLGCWNRSTRLSWRASCRGAGLITQAYFLGATMSSAAAQFDIGNFHFAHGFRLDLLVERAVAVELKSVEQLQHVHRAQLLTYIRLLHLPIGLLINFGGLTLKEGLVRLVNNLPASPTRRLIIDRRDPREAR